MTVILDTSPVSLDPAHFLRLTRAAGTTIECLDGLLWLTRDGCLTDFELAPGQRYVLEDNARVLVTAFVPSRAMVSHPPGARADRTSGVGSWKKELRALMVALGFVAPGSSWAQADFICATVKQAAPAQVDVTPGR